MSFTNSKDLFYSTSCLKKITITPKCLCPIQLRTFINFLNPPNSGNTKKEYKEKKLIG